MKVISMQRIVFVLFIVIGAVVGAMAEPPDGPIRLPFNAQQQLILVQGTLNDSLPILLALDDGAPMTVLHSRVAKDKNLPLQTRAVGPPPIKGRDSLRITLTPNVTLGLGSLRIPSKAILVRDLSPLVLATGIAVDAVIGQDLLSRMIICYDFPAGEIRIALADQPAANELRQGTMIPSLAPKGRFILPGAIGIDTKVTCLADLNANVCAIDVNLSGVVPMPKDSTIRESPPMEGQSEIMLIPTMTLGTVRMDSVEAIRLDLREVNAKLTRPVQAVIGRNVWSRCRVTFDYPQHVLYLSRH